MKNIIIENTIAAVQELQKLKDCPFYACTISEGGIKFQGDIDQCFRPALAAGYCDWKYDRETSFMNLATAFKDGIKLNIVLT